jgi:hypothetical protein
MKVTVEEKNYIVKKPGQKELSKAKLESNRVFKKALSTDEYFLREELYNILRKRGFWNDEKEDELNDLRKQIGEKELVLSKGGIELNEAKEVALTLRLLRYKLLLLTAKEREFDELTVEAQSDNAYFDTLVSECVYDEEGKKVYSSYQDYLDKKSETYSYECASALAEMLYEFKDFERTLPENSFLLEYGFVDSELKLIEDEVVEEKEEEVVTFKPFLKDGEPVNKTE